MFSQRNNPYCDLLEIFLVSGRKDKAKNNNFQILFQFFYMKNILGLDLGTNSIGWALIQTDDEGKTYQRDIKLGSRIIPMTQDVLGAFEGGAPIQTQTASRTQKRGMRRLYERRALRRERLLRVLHILGFLPEHYDHAIGWNPRQTKTFCKFINPDEEPKIAWTRDAQGKPLFLFQDSFKEMLGDFKAKQPQLVAKDKKIPYDWTLYYLRQKGLLEPITKEELAWILLNFNQKRGYYQLRGKDEISQDEDKSKIVEYIEQVVTDVDFDPNEKEYNVHLANGMILCKHSQKSLKDWIGKKREFIVTTDLDDQGNPKLNKEGEIKRSFRAPDANDWTLRKVRTEYSVAQSGMTIGAYIYQHLLSDPSGKIIGKFVETIDRHFYKDELNAILKKQSEFHPELKDQSMLEACSEALYGHNSARQFSLKQKDMTYLLIEDILFYQRPLKSKKSLISNCPFESHTFVDKETGEVKIKFIKCIAKSNPYFQEYRIRQFMQNLKIYDLSELEEKDVTSIYFPDLEAWERLYLWLSDRDNVNQESFLKEFLGIKKSKSKDAKNPLRWNYVEDKEKKYPVGETRALLKSCLEKAGVAASLLDDFDVEYRLWHLLYSIDDMNELKGALRKFALCYQIIDIDSFVEAFSKAKPFDKNYGNYSEKAIKKLLTLMRQGIRSEVACEQLYEKKPAEKWTSPSDIHAFIMDFQQHSLRNPIVEQCILETLRTVADIWQQCGHIDEIHLELGREMKNPADKRQQISNRNRVNENTNLRIRALLTELLNDPNIKDVRPNSPMQQDILRIYEEGALTELKSSDPDYKEILDISRLAQPSTSQLTRYKLWLEQRYRSPYTGRVIPLARLFTPAYQIEHVIPRARYYDDSLNNKVICEAEVNKDKTNLLAHEYICQNGGKLITTTSGTVKVFNKEEFEQFVQDHYAQLRTKKRNLLLDDIPEEFIQRQMNDSRYISRYVKALLSNIVRSDENDDLETSKNVIVCTGSVTDRLKKDWGLVDVWNQLIYPRFERLNNLTGTNLFGQWVNKDGKRYFQTDMPLALRKGFTKKRIDHRHHAMDALVIACASRNIVSLLSNMNANKTEQREDLKRLLTGKGGLFYKPWPTFTQDVYQALTGVVISFKNKVRVLSRASNYYEHYDAEGRKRQVAQKGGKQFVVRKPLHEETIYGHVNLRLKKFVTIKAALEDVKNIVNASLRKRITELISQGLDKKGVIGKLAKEGIGKQIEIFYFTDSQEPLVATRKKLDESFGTKKILSITDTGIQRILLNYLSYNGGDPKVAFSAEGIIELNEHIADFNHGRSHQPILNVRLYKTQGEMFKIGEQGNKAKKYAKTEGGTNLYFAIYESANGDRTYETIPLNLVIERLKQGMTPVPDYKDGFPLHFSLSPLDLVYVPTEDERQTFNIDINDLDRNRIYKYVKGWSNRACFIPHRISSLLLAVKGDVNFGCNNQVINEVSISNDSGVIEKEQGQPSIKSVCWKLEVNRLGQITKIIR